MNEVLSLFLAADAPAPAAPVRRPVTARTAGVVASTDDLLPAAGAVGAALRAGGPAVVVSRLPALTARPALRAAATLARRLERRGHRAAAAGALCRVADADEREAWRVIGAADAPVVVAVPRRSEAADALLAELDLVVLAVPPDAPPDLTDLARASLEALGPPVLVVPPPAGVAARWAAAAGMVRGPVLCEVPR